MCAQVWCVVVLLCCDCVLLVCLCVADGCSQIVKWSISKVRKKATVEFLSGNLKSTFELNRNRKSDEQFTIYFLGSNVIVKLKSN